MKRLSKIGAPLIAAVAVAGVASSGQLFADQHVMTRPVAAAVSPAPELLTW